MYIILVGKEEGTISEGPGPPTEGVSDVRRPTSKPPPGVQHTKGLPFIPYRDSVLTWLLKDTLGGNANTFMIASKLKIII